MRKYLRLALVQARISAASGMAYRSDFLIEGVMTVAWAALTLLPLAEAAALGFAAPLLTTALAGPLLGERVGPWRWAAIVLGFGGVLIVVPPKLTGQGDTRLSVRWRRDY